MKLPHRRQVLPQQTVADSDERAQVEASRTGLVAAVGLEPSMSVEEAVRQLDPSTIS
jgi:hypothetical protein